MERNPKITDDHIVEAEIHTKGPSLHGRESAPTYEAAVDLLVDKLERQIERYRDKRVHERRRRSAGVRERTPPGEPESAQESAA
jgi:ribosomal subunit interface protein